MPHAKFMFHTNTLTHTLLGIITVIHFTYRVPPLDLSYGARLNIQTALAISGIGAGSLRVSFLLLLQEQQTI